MEPISYTEAKNRIHGALVQANELVPTVSLGLEIMIAAAIDECLSLGLDKASLDEIKVSPSMVVKLKERMNYWHQGYAVEHLSSQPVNSAYHVSDTRLFGLGKNYLDSGDMLRRRVERVISAPKERAVAFAAATKIIEQDLRSALSVYKKRSSRDPSIIVDPLLRGIVFGAATPTQKLAVVLEEKGVCLSALFEERCGKIFANAISSLLDNYSSSGR